MLFRTTSALTINTFKNINIFINLFNVNLLSGVKQLNYIKFCEAMKIINKKEHLTLEGSKKNNIKISNE